MDQTKSVQGSCLCGSITITASSMKTNLGVCHCSTCRKWTGGPFTTVDCGTDVTIQGIESLGTYNSSEWAERSFCKDCGTTLFYKLKEAQQYICSSEIFNEEDFVFDHQIFIDEKPKYYSFANETKNMTGAEVFAAYENKE